MSRATPHTVAVRALRRADPDLGRVVEQIGSCRLTYRRSVNPFQELLRSIVYQQLSGHAAGAIHRRVRGLFPGGRPSVRALCALSDANLREAGLSRAKVLALRSLAEHAIAGTIPGPKALRLMSDEEVVARLVQIRGIGQWTVEMMLLFHLGRPDVMPATDLGIRKGFRYLRNAKELPAPREILEYSSRWRPHRSVASWYLWRASEL